MNEGPPQPIPLKNFLIQGATASTEQAARAAMSASTVPLNPILTSESVRAATEADNLVHQMGILIPLIDESISQIRKALVEANLPVIPANAHIDLTITFEGPADFGFGLERTELTEEQKQITLDDLDLSVRTYNTLSRFRLKIVGDMAQRTKDEMLALRNFGDKSMEDLETALSKKGIVLWDKPPLQRRP